MKDNKNSTILLDLDDTLCDFSGVLQKGLALETNQDIPVNSWLNYDLIKIYRNINHQHVKNAIVKNKLFLTVRPFPSIQKQLNTLSEKGFNLIIATARGSFDENGEQTKKWLSDHKIPYDELILTSHKIGKSDIAKNINPAFSIDDNLRYSHECSPFASKTVVRNAPWNKDVLVDFERVDNFKSFMDIVLKNKEFWWKKLIITKFLSPPIKSQGIKTKLVSWIKETLPNDFDGKFIEPFMGTGVVGFNLVTQKLLQADANPHLINFYQSVLEGKITSEIVRLFLEKEGAILSKKGDEHYYFIRDRFNKKHDALDFLFLNRASFNGLIRFNQKGGFNTPFCKNDNRFSKSYIIKIVNQVKNLEILMKEKEFTFKKQSFEETIKEATSEDIIYCDPPYINKNNQYFQGWDEALEFKLFKSLSETQSKFILSSWYYDKKSHNDYIDILWSKFNIKEKEHFYHIGSKKEYRGNVMEVLITNF